MSAPEVGTRSTCARCGKAVWLRKVGEAGNGEHRGQDVLQWCARRGSKPAPIRCPVSDGWPTTYHQAKGFDVIYWRGEVWSRPDYLS